jgi:hypothetical protein
MIDRCRQAPVSGAAVWGCRSFLVARTLIKQPIDDDAVCALQRVGLRGWHEIDKTLVRLGFWVRYNQTPCGGRNFGVLRCVPQRAYSFSELFPSFLAA